MVVYLIHIVRPTVFVMTLAYWCPVKSCSKECKLTRGLTQHINAFHCQQPLVSDQGPLSKTAFQRWTHPQLTGESVSHLCWLF